MKIFTIGFTQTSAEDFFTRLKRSGAKTLIDVRLNNVSQLAGFAKKGDLRYFVENLCGMGYTHIPALAPTKELLEPVVFDRPALSPNAMLKAPVVFSYNVSKPTAVLSSVPFLNKA